MERHYLFVQQIGPILVGDGNLISGASGLILADAGTEDLYKGWPVAQLPSFINRRFRADYLATGMTTTSDCHLLHEYSNSGWPVG